jgi:hypothetical protein
MKQVEVGLWKLPGLAFKKGQISPELNKEMMEWARNEGVGMSMTENLWSFRKSSHREWFIMRWIDHIPKVEEDEE